MSHAPETPDRNLAMELVRVTEAAAMAAGRWVGRGDKLGGDGAAVDAMRQLIGTVSMNGVVVIGEGEKDEAPMLYNGEQIGDGSPPSMDIAVDPVDDDADAQVLAGEVPAPAVARLQPERDRKALSQQGIQDRHAVAGSEERQRGAHSLSELGRWSIRSRASQSVPADPAFAAPPDAPAARGPLGRADHERAEARVRRP